MSNANMWDYSVDWKPLGEVVIEDNQIIMPEYVGKNIEPKTSGLYWLRLNNIDYHYIGQTKRLKERLGEYRKPTQGTFQEYYIHQALKDNGGAHLSISICCKDKLRELETNEIRLACAANQKLLNRTGVKNKTAKDIAEAALRNLMNDWLKGINFGEDEEVKQCK